MTWSDLSATRTAYDGLAAVYDIWSAADPAWLPSRRFYLAQAAAARLGVVELCVGTGRLAVEIARRGIPVIGVDFSHEMLARCRERVATGTDGPLELLEADIRHVSLRRPVDIVILPFRGIGHFLTPADRQAVFATAYRALAPGGRFVLDHYVFNPEWAQERDGVPQLLSCELEHDGSSRSIIDTYQYNFSACQMTCVTSVERRAPDGTVRRTDHRFQFAWLEPDEIRTAAEETGFRVVALYGDFDCSEFRDESPNQIWIFRREEP